MNKTQIAERKIINAGYKIEWTDFFKGKRFVKAIKENEKTVVATNILSLYKILKLEP